MKFGIINKCLYNSRSEDLAVNIVIRGLRAYRSDTDTDTVCLLPERYLRSERSAVDRRAFLFGPMICSRVGLGNTERPHSESVDIDNIDLNTAVIAERGQLVQCERNKLLGLGSTEHLRKIVIILKP